MERGRRGNRWTAAIGAFVALVVGCVALGAGPAGAQETSGVEHVDSWKVDVTVQDDGSVLVREQIAWDFGYTPKHGIYRDIPTHFRYDDVKKGWDRVTPIDQISVTSPDASATYEKSQEGDDTRLKIGDGDTKITGLHHYEIRYRMRGVLNHFEDHDELNLNLVGLGVTTSIREVTGTIRVPGKVTQATCFAGPAYSQLPCDSHTESEGTATFRHTNLSAYQGLTAVVAFPTGLVPTPQPILDQRWTIQNAFAARTNTIMPAAGLAGLSVLGAIGLLWKVGRDKRFAGSATDVAFGGTGLGEETVPLTGRDPVPVQFEPPDGLRPGQIGTLIDEQANPLDVTATIIDLAVRGYLQIEEIPKQGWFGKPDWKLTKRKDDMDGLLHYERKLFSSLFGSSNEKLLSELKDHFATKLEAVEELLYKDVIRQGWFVKRPDKVRTHWRWAGIGLTVAGVALTIGLAAATTFGIVGLGVVFAGLVLIAIAGRLPRRTAKGYAVLQRVDGFRTFIEESEKDRAQFAERANLFTEYLPYAVVFGATEKWAKAFEGLEGQLPAQSWYISPHPFTVVGFGHAMDGFTTTTAGTISSVPASSGGSGFSGGGFSGGGFGGGGAGSW